MTDTSAPGTGSAPAPTTGPETQAPVASTTGPTAETSTTVEAQASEPGSPAETEAVTAEAGTEQKGKLFTQEDLNRIDAAARRKHDDAMNAVRGELDEAVKASETLQSEVDRLNIELGEIKLKNTQAQVALNTGVSVDVVSKLAGNTVEELTVAVEALRSSFGAPVVPQQSQSTQTPSSFWEASNKDYGQTGGGELDAIRKKYGVK